MKKNVALFLPVLVCILLAACSSSASVSSSSSSTSVKSDASTDDTVSKSSVAAFDMYKKVSLGMTKDQVDATLVVKPVVNTAGNVQNAYNYTDKDGFTVYVCYNSSNKVFAKTAVYDGHEVLSALTKKPINEDQVDKISRGMPYKDVVNLLGGEGVECCLTCLSEDYSHPGAIRRWGNKDGSTIQVTFLKDDTASMAIFYQR